MSSELLAEVDRSPWCARCDHSVRGRNHRYKWIRIDGVTVGPFCSYTCADCWVIGNDPRIGAEWYDYEPIGGQGHE